MNDDLLVFLSSVMLFAGAVAAAGLLYAAWRLGIGWFLGLIGRGLVWADGLLVRSATWLVGTRWQGRNRRLLRWGHLLVLLLGLALLGSLMPVHAAVFAIGLGFLSAIAVIRHWHWDEEDRLANLRPQERRVPGGEDLRNEAVVAGASLFLFAPILLARLDESLGLFNGALAGRPSGYALFALWELAKSTPIFDISEVYDWGYRFGAEPEPGWGRGVTLALRIAFDLAVISSAVQLIGVLSRVASGEDLRAIESDLTGVKASDESRSRAVDRLAALAKRGQANAQLRLARFVDERNSIQDYEFAPELRFRAANALLAVADRMGNNVLLRAAIDAYRVLVRSFEPPSPDWAATQHNLGGALQTLGKRLGGAEGIERLDEAVAAYRAALEVRTRADAPADWAATHHNLGTALNTIGERRGGADGIGLVVEATDHFNAALQVRTLEDAPADWAATQNNLGNAFLTLGQQLDGLDGLRALASADNAFRNALKVRTREDANNWAMTQHNLGNVLTTLGDRLGPEGTERLGEAVAAYRAALTVRTRADTPAEWAQTQNSLGVTLQALGWRLEGAQGVDRLVEAVAACRAALEVRDRDDATADWAMTQNNLGNALASLGERLPGAQGCAKFDEAIDAFTAALKQFDAMQAATYASAAHQGLDRATKVRAERRGNAN